MLASVEKVNAKALTKGIQRDTEEHGKANPLVDTIRTA